MSSKIIVFIGSVLFVLSISSCKKDPVVLQEHILTPMFDKKVCIDSLLIQTRIAVDSTAVYKKDSLPVFSILIK
ncbi:hypothetical protein [Myroides sp. LJL119]